MWYMVTLGHTSVTILTSSKSNRQGGVAGAEAVPAQGDPRLHPARQVGHGGVGHLHAKHDAGRPGNAASAGERGRGFLIEIKDRIMIGNSSKHKFNSILLMT